MWLVEYPWVPESGIFGVAGIRIFGMISAVSIPRFSRGFVMQMVLMVVVFGLFGLSQITPTWSGTPAWMVPCVLLGMAVAFGGLLLQRVYPERGLVVTGVGMTLMALSVYYGLSLGFLLVVYEAYFIGAVLNIRRRFWLSILLTGALIAHCAIILIYEAKPPYSPDPANWSNLMMPGVATRLLIGNIIVVVFCGLAWMIGRDRRRRRRELEELQAKAELAALNERNRIAREMHDIVAHSLTVVIAQADGGRYAGRKDPDKAIEALETISARGRDALGQLRSLLSVLREGNGVNEERSTSTAPGVGSIPDLIVSANRSGVRAYFEQSGAPKGGQVSDLLELTLYRIVQESLTNVLKHAGSVETVVRLWWTREYVLLKVDNEPGHDQIEGSGRGLTGIAERVRIHGGSVSWGESQEYKGGWNVSVQLPLA